MVAAHSKGPLDSRPAINVEITNVSELQTERSGFPLHMLLPTLSRGGLKRASLNMLTDGTEMASVPLCRNLL